MEDEKMGSTRSSASGGTEWCDPFLFPFEVMIPMECQIEVNKKRCNCTYDPCPRKGICCECVAYHRVQNQLPACYFSKDAERTYDRSVEKFLSLHLQRKK